MRVKKKTLPLRPQWKSSGCVNKKRTKVFLKDLEMMGHWPNKHKECPLSSLFRGKIAHAYRFKINKNSHVWSVVKKPWCMLLH